MNIFIILKIIHYFHYFLYEYIHIKKEVSLYAAPGTYIDVSQDEDFPTI
jgi:hypothetical protein